MERTVFPANLGHRQMDTNGQWYVVNGVFAVDNNFGDVLSDNGF